MPKLRYSIPVCLLAVSSCLGQDSPKTVAIGGQVLQSKLIHHVPPEYPPLAKGARIQGGVRLDATIGTGGSVESLSVISGHPILATAALEAVRQWKYRQTFLNGEPVRVKSEVTVNFVLDGGSAPLSQSPSEPRLRLIGRIVPPYPPLAKQARIQGRVKIEINVSAGGLVDQVRLISGHELLMEAAMDAVRKWKFEPQVLNGAPAQAFGMVELEFALGPEGSDRDSVRILSPPGLSEAPPVVTTRQGARVVHRVLPQYPPLAKGAGVAGVVLLEVTVAKSGLVESVRVLAGHPLLVEAAVAAVRQWQYQPILVNGEPLGVVTIEEVDFSLR